MLNILLNGCFGKLSRAVIEFAATDDGTRIAAGVDPCAGNENAPAIHFPVFKTPYEVEGVRPDVLVDCSLPAALPGLLEYAIGAGLPLVIATTGYGEAEYTKLAQAARLIPVFQSGNMSLGIFLLKALARQAACALEREGFDIEIIEAHHNKKIDAPSGTAYILADAVNEGLTWPRPLAFERESRRAPRPREEIGMHSVRGGTLVGEHTVLFAGFDETITLTHRAQSKRVFAAGCVAAARFLKDKPAGRYGMEDLMAPCLH
jgi:4-hydroxy-tetrahydrodipicolinate reductase